ncbi:hypothetical protein D9M71_453230 [compost metagenome]
MGIHPRRHQGIQGGVDHGRGTTGIDAQLPEVREVLANRLMQHAASPLPTALVADHLVQGEIVQALPVFPVRQLIEIIRLAHPPVQVHRVLEASGAAMLDQAVYLTHPGARRDQHQRAVRQLRQVGVAEGHPHLGHARALQLFDERAGTALAAEYVQLDVTPGAGGGGHGEGRGLAVVPLDQQVLPGVVARRLAGRGAQAHAPDIPAHRGAFGELAAERTHRQLAR